MSKMSARKWRDLWQTKCAYPPPQKKSFLRGGTQLFCQDFREEDDSHNEEGEKWETAGQRQMTTGKKYGKTLDKSFGANICVKQCGKESKYESKLVVWRVKVTPSQVYSEVFRVETHV